MGIFDFIFGNNKKEEEARLERERQEKLKREREEKARIEAEKRRKEQESSSIEPFVFKSNCHQRYESGEPKLGLQECIRTIRVEKNTNGCSGYKLSPGKGYIVKIFNDDLGKPNMSDKPMRVVRRTADVVELRGFPIEAQTPFGWQEIDMSDYGLLVYYKAGKVEKCRLHMYDRDTFIEYCQKNVQIQPFTQGISIKKIVDGEPFETDLFVYVYKQPYNGDSVQINISKGAKATLKRVSKNGNVSITFSNIGELQAKGILQTDLILSPSFNYSKEDSDEFATAEINNSFAALTSGKEYISLFQMTRQKGKLVSFLINNLPNVGDYYYLIMLRED